MSQYYTWPTIILFVFLDVSYGKYNTILLDSYIQKRDTNDTNSCSFLDSSDGWLNIIK